MSATRTVLRQVGYEQRSFWRNPASASFTIAFPLVFLVVFIAINGNDTVRLPGGTVKFAQFYVPAIVAFGIISAAYTNLAFLLSVRRDNGLLKRVRSTPLSTSAYLGGIGGNVVIVSAILTALVTVLGVVAYGIEFPGRYVALLAALAIGAFTFAGLGALVATFVPNEDAAPAIINFALFPLLFISGTFGRVDPDSTLGRIASIFPIAHFNRMLEAVFNPHITGFGIGAWDTVVVLVWGVGSMALATRRFRWEPRRR